MNISNNGKFAGKRKIELFVVAYRNMGFDIGVIMEIDMQIYHTN